MKRPALVGRAFVRSGALCGSRLTASCHEMKDHLLDTSFVAQVRELTRLVLNRHYEVGLFSAMLFPNGVTKCHGQLLHAPIILVGEQL